MFCAYARMLLARAGLARASFLPRLQITWTTVSDMPARWMSCTAMLTRPPEFVHETTATETHEQQQRQWTRRNSKTHDAAASAAAAAAAANNADQHTVV
jgi:hypothetical protein